MDEARKPFEYDDEQGVSDFVFLFFIMLLLFEMCYGVIVLVQVNRAFGSVPVLGGILLAASVLLLLSIVFTCIALFKLKKQAVRIVKGFLIARTAYLTLTSVAVFIKTVTNKYAIGGGPEQFESIPVMIIMLLVTPLFYTLAFGISWYIYFCRSKRVRRTYSDAAENEKAV